MTTTNYLDYAGLQRFKTNLDALYASLYRTQAQVDTQIQNKLDTYSTNLVTVQSTKPTVQEAVEGRIYVVPDTNGESGELQFIAYTKEEVNGQYEIITIGHSRVIIPPVSQTVTAGDQAGVSGGAVYNYAVAKTDVTDTVSDGETKVVTGDAVFEFAVAKTSIVDQVVDNNQNPVTSNAVYDYAVALANVADTIANDNMNPVTSNAVYDALANIQAIPNPEIDVMFMPSTEIWIDSTGWATMKAKYETSGEFVPLTKNSSGYYVIVPGDVTTVDTLVLATVDDSISTGVLTDVTSASDLAGFNGKIVAAEDQATTLTVLA